MKPIPIQAHRHDGETLIQIEAEYDPEKDEIDFENAEITRDGEPIRFEDLPEHQQDLIEEAAWDETRHY